MGDNLRIVSAVERITPTIARKYLQMNGNNPRRINKSAIYAYAEDMKAGKWLLNGEAIVFDEEGNLRNGQHRLHAVVKADVGVDFLVVRGVAKDTSIYDMQIRRTISQELNIANTVESVAAAIVANCYKNCCLVPKSTVYDYIVKHESDLNLAYSISYNGAKKAKARKRDVVLAIYLLIRRSNGDSVEGLRQFFSVVNSGFPLDNKVSTPAIVYAKALPTITTKKNRPEMLKNIETLIAAYGDFTMGVNRKVAYKINATDRAEHALDMVRKMDGLSE